MPPWGGVGWCVCVWRTLVASRFFSPPILDFLLANALAGHQQALQDITDALQPTSPLQLIFVQTALVDAVYARLGTFLWRAKQLHR